MKRVLCIVSAMNAGGAETFLMKLYRNLDKSKYQMDFCVNTNENFFSNEISKLGGRIYVIPVKSKYPIKSFTSLMNLVKKKKYRCVMRVNEHSLATIDLVAAKLGGAKRLIMRSSNASSGSKVSIMLHKLFFFLPRMIPNVKIAPSTEAAEYTFGKGCVSRKKVELLHNGLDLEYYRYDQQKRKKLRNELNIADKMVIGHIGRFSAQKNHLFLIDVFEIIYRKRENAVLLLVGDGELKKQVEECVKKKGISDRVLFLGVRSDIPDILSAMDVFVFPSLYEGMPNTVIEAQATGLQCIVSDSITSEANITGLVTYISLHNNKTTWAKCIIEKYDHQLTREQNLKMQEEYSINVVTKRFQNLIFGDE